MPSLLQIDGLTVDFATEDGIVHAVRGVSLNVNAGQMLGVVGESGSGKSVTMLTVMGLTRGSGTTIGGTATFDGRDLLTWPGEDLRRIRGRDIAMIFQDPLSSLHPFYKVGTQLIEAIRRTRRRSARPVMPLFLPGHDKCKAQKDGAPGPPWCTDPAAGWEQSTLHRTDGSFPTLPGAHAAAEVSRAAAGRSAVHAHTSAPHA